MSTNVVVVESPAKARTIEKYLGPGFTVLASYGHVRDLVPKEGAVDPDNGYAMQYKIIEKNEKHIQAIAKKLIKETAPARDRDYLDAWTAQLIAEIRQTDEAAEGLAAFFDKRPATWKT